MRGRVLVAGVGNIFLGDDAFGCEVARRMSIRHSDDEVTVADFGIRGFDLACALTDGYETAVLVDACERGGEPGTLYVIEPEVRDEGGGLEPHAMKPEKVLAFASTFGDLPKNTFIVGCEPQFTGADADGHMGLSLPVSDSVERAVEIVESLINGS